MANFRDMSIRAKIALTAALITILNVSTMVIYSALNQFRVAEQNGYLVADDAASDAVNTITTRLSLAMSAAQNNANAIMGLRAAGEANRTRINAMLRRGLESHPELLGMYTGWEPNAFDGSDATYADNKAMGSNADGRYMPYFVWVGGRVELEPLLGYDKPGIGDYYLIARKTGRTALIDPYNYPVGGETMLMTSLIQPLLIGGRFVGISGVDINVRQLQKELAAIRPMGTGALYLYSTNRQIVSAPEAERIGSKVPDEEVSAEDWSVTTSGKKIHYIDSRGSARFLVPVHVKAFDTSWVLDVRIPHSTIIAEAVKTRNGAILIGVLFLLLDVTLVSWMVIRQLGPLHDLRIVIEGASEDLLADKEFHRLPLERSDEIGMLARAFQSLRQRLSESFSMLEKRVQDRTIEANEARRKAEAANEAKSVFLANMSHELRTPLNAILGFSRILERDSDMGVESKKKLATINRAGQHLLELINDVLDISRIEAGHIIIQKAPFDLTGLIMTVEEIIHARAEAKGLAFHVEHLSNLPLYVEGDEHHLKQVLVNLLGNAVKYTTQGSVCHRVSRRNGEIVFEVSDTGCGISEEDQKNLFQAFYQTDSAISQGEGTGLGLAISLEYTRHMGGKIEVSSQLGKGSIFTLIMPLHETNLAVARQSGNRRLRLEEGQGSVRVLVVDDKEDNRELVKALLEEADFEIRTADNGQQAVEFFQNWHPRMILMDMRMPVLDGYEATRKIRRLPGGDKVKIVALTASAFEDDRQKIMEAGCNDMVRKPIEEEKLFAIMGKFLELRYRQNYTVAPPESSSKTNELDLKMLPSQVVKELREAADALDLESVQHIVKRLQESHPELAARLDEMIPGFRFDRIAELCKTAEEERKQPIDT